ncbi:MAG: phosphatase PAP2 family protein [Clostridia bacterium]|jgi:undecaprenyl-diphosphatase|nr:phosphatase PAP2 family protein [Clostridia bacterium]
MKNKTKRKILICIRRNIRWIILLFCMVLFFSILKDIFRNEIWEFDNQIYKYISKFISDPVTLIFKIITNCSSAVFVLILTMLIVFIPKDKRYGKYITINLIIVTLLNQILKYIIQRPRPTEFRIINESGYSFPSGHSMVSMAFYGFIIYLVYHNVENKKVKWFLCTILTMLIPLIGISRIYLGVHYTSDVIGGFCLSMAYLIIYTKIVSKQVKNI